MENFSFCTPTEFLFGKATQSSTGAMLKKHGARRILVVSGGNSARKSGLLPDILSQITRDGLHYVELGGIMPNPTAEKVYEGIDMVRNNELDFILAIGGGSVIDTAKAIALGALYQGDFWDLYSGKATPTSALYTGVVLTIPASGSEASGNSVITKVDAGGAHKLSVRYPGILRPRFAVMNPELTYTLPWFQTACGAVDIIGHIMERYFSNTTGCMTDDTIAEALMTTVMKCVHTLRHNPDDYDARANIMWAGNLAHNGLCGVGKEEDWASHRLEHEVSAYYNVAHGAGLAVIYPAWMAFVARKNPGQVVRFALNVMGIEGKGKSEAQIAFEGIEALKKFYHSIGLTTSLEKLIGCKPDIDMLVNSLRLNMGSAIGCYVKLSMDDCAEIYHLAE